MATASSVPANAGVPDGYPTNPCGGTNQNSCSTPPDSDGKYDYYACLTWTSITIPSGASVMKCTSWNYIAAQTGGTPGGGSTGGGSTGGTSTAIAHLVFKPNIGSNTIFDIGNVQGFPADITSNGKDGTSAKIKIPSAEMKRLDDPSMKFVYWSKTADDSSSRYYPGDYVTLDYGTTATLYAIWTKTADNPPTITTPGDTTIHVSDSFDPMQGVSATDDVDGDLTGSIKVTGSVDTSSPGSALLTYTVADSAGNTATAQRTITVIANGTTIACAPQTGDPAASIWQSITMLIGLVAFGLAGYMLVLRRRLACGTTLYGSPENR